MAGMNFIFIFISSAFPNFLGKKSVKQKINHMTNGPVNAHLISGITVLAQNIQNLGKMAE